MALNFPATPEEGDLYTAEGVTYVWRTNRWVKVSDEELDPVEIVEADVSQGWQVWGDTLIQWGVAQTAADGNVTVTFEQAFKTAPYAPAHSTNEAGNNVIDPCNTTNLTASTMLIRCRTVQNTGVSPTVRGVRWIAIGEAPDALKKPKVVQTIGGSELQEYHDPAGVASWRIVGTTLECWGRATPVSGGAAVTFPKTFARRPEVTATVSGLSGDIPADGVYSIMSEVAGVGAVSFRERYVNSTTGVVANVPFSWHAIGEWDGVS